MSKLGKKALLRSCVRTWVANRSLRCHDMTVGVKLPFNLFAPCGAEGHNDTGSTSCTPILQPRVLKISKLPKLPTKLVKRSCGPMIVNHAQHYDSANSIKGYDEERTLESRSFWKHWLRNIGNDIVAEFGACFDP